MPHADPEARNKYMRGYYARKPAAQRARVKKNNNLGRQKAKALVLEYLQGHPCVDCGEPDPIVLEFDHVRGREDRQRRGHSLSGQFDEVAGRNREV